MRVIPDVNPVLERELRQRLRGRAAWVSLTLYLVVLGLILRLVYDVVSTSESVMGSQAQAASAAGRSILHWLLFVMLGLICFIVPGLTAGAIASERERQTLVPLQITLLGARSIVVGKLLASLAFVVLLVIAALPFLSVSFLLGGVSVVEVVKGLAMVLVVAVAIASVALACSSAVRRTQTATVTAYGIVALLVIGTFVVYGAQRALDRSVTGASKPTVLVVNPFAATAEVVRGRAGAEFNLNSPFRPMQDLLSDDVFSGGFDEGPDGPVFVGPGGFPLRPPSEAPGTVPVQPASGQGFAVVERRASVAGAQAQVDDDGFVIPDRRPKVLGMPFWTASLLSYGAMTALSLVIAVRRVSVPARGRAE